MNGILLDSSAYSELIRGNKEVLAAIQRAECIALNPIILGELLSGFMQGTQELQNSKYLEKFLESDRTLILPIIKETAQRYTHIHSALRKAGKPIPTNDIWIAATAMEHGLEVVTFDKHFAIIPQILCKLYKK